jgi:DNA topoisomerase-1
MGTLEKEKEKIKISIKKAQMKQDTVGNCNKCGKPMIIRTSKRNKRFVGCTGFPDCKNTFSLPQKGSVIVTEKICEECNSPIVKIKSKGKGAWKLCINNVCPANKPSSKK